MIVADTNLVAYLMVEGTRTPEARRVWSLDPDWVLPPLWRSEFLNVLWLAVRSSVLDEEQATLAWRRASTLFARLEKEPEAEQVLSAALRYGISAYDAHFVVLAEERNVPLVTADKKLCRACPRLAVLITDFGKRPRDGDRRGT